MSKQQHHEDLRDVLWGASLSLVGLLSNLAARLSFLLVAGNYYGETELGRYAYAIALIEVLAATSVFGFKRALFNELNDDRKAGRDPGSSIAHALIVSLSIALALAIVLSTIAWDAIGMPYGELMGPAFAFVIPLIALSDVLLSATRFKRTLRWFVFARNIAEPWTLLTVAFLLHKTGAPQGGLMVAYFSALAIAAFVSAVGVSRLFGLRTLLVPIRWQRLVEVAKGAAPTAPVDLGELLYRKIDILIVKQFVSIETVGVYFVAQQIATNVQRTRHIFDPIVAPIISHVMADGRLKDAEGQIGQICRWIFTLQILVMGILLFYGEEIISIFGVDAALAGLIAVILLAAEVFDGSFGLTELPIVYRRPKVNLMLSATAITVEVVACTLLAWQFGAVGAAFGFFAGMVLLALLRLATIKRLFGMKPIGAPFFKPILAFVIMIAIGLALEHLAVGTPALWITAGPVALIVIFAATIRLMGLSPADTELLKALRG